MNTTNNLQVFENELFNIRTIFIDEEPWFIAKDICSILGLANTTVAINNLEENDCVKIDIGGRQGLLNAVNKKGLLDIILSSRKKDNRKFIKSIIESVSDLDGILKALNDFEIPEDLPDMYVYAIKNTVTGNVKLGISKDPENRLKQLQTGNDCKLELLTMRKATNRFYDETLLHEKYKESRIRGEWFRGDVIKGLE